MQCPQCGQHNDPDDRFCSNCGTKLEGRADLPPQYTPPERDARPHSAAPGEPIPDDPRAPEWRMSPLPEEAPPKRRTWLWVLVGLIAFCVLLFCGFSLFVGFTDMGQNLMDDLATRAAEVATPVD